MQIHLSSALIKRQAQILVEFLKGEGIELKLAHGVEAASKMNGFRDWRTANGTLPAEAPKAVAPPMAGRLPAHVPELEPALLQIVDRRLAEAVKAIDDRVHRELRVVFNGLNPLQGTRRWIEILDQQERTVHDGLQARAAAIRAVLLQLRNEYRLVGDELSRQVFQLVIKHFPEGLYFNVVKDISPEAFERAVNRTLNEPEARHHNSKCGLIEASSLNGRGRSLGEIRTDLLEWQLNAALSVEDLARRKTKTRPARR